MPNLKASIKDVRKTARRNAHNKHIRSVVKSSIKKTRSIIEDGAPDEAQQSLSMTKKILDKAAKRIIHPNKASRLKSRLESAITSMQEKPKKPTAKRK